MIRRVSTVSPIRFEWLSAGGDWFRARGMTRDISNGGVFSYVEYPLPAGLEVTYDVIFPPERVRREAVILRCRGRVLRCEKLHDRSGVAVSMESLHLIDTAALYRRASERVVPASTVIARYAGLHAAVRDLSPIGAFIESRDPLPLGQRIALGLQTREWSSEIELYAIVRRVEPTGGMGVEFVILTPDANRQLRELVRNGTTA